ncbi:MAG: nitronate monooxygenase family protein [Microscillaceae bacterium]
MNKLPYQSTLRLPLVAAPMFLISNPALVSECCKNGVVGTFPALNQRSSEGFEAWLNEIAAHLQDFEAQTAQKPAPFGVNLIVHHTNPRLQADLEICIRHKVPLIITSLGIVPEVIEAVHGYGGLVYHDVTNLRHAQKAAGAGVDGLILVAAGAGGHAGTLNPIAFVNEIRAFFDKTILLSGCLSTGQDIAAALTMGADLAYMGTRFINTIEGQAPPEYQQMIVDSKTADIVYTAAVSGVPANFMRQSLEKAGISEEMLKSAARIDFGKELDSEAKAWKTIWSAGQGVTSIQDVLPVRDLISRMKQEFAQSLQKQQQLQQQYGL